MISYAHNHEDVLLNRGFSGLQKGFYIDVGAASPLVHSVTRHFYESGWNGINIDPEPHAQEQFRQHRPHDVNLGVGLSDCSGDMTFYIVSTAILHPDLRYSQSTFDPDTAEDFCKQGSLVSESRARVTTLEEVCSSHALGEIHFLRINVQGSEHRIIAGMDWNRWRPRIVLVHCPDDRGARQHQKQWEPILMEQGYLFAQFDGVNRFYVSKEDSEFVKVISVPVNYLDSFIPAKLAELNDEMADLRKFAQAVDWNPAGAYAKIQWLQEELARLTYGVGDSSLRFGLWVARALHRSRLLLTNRRPSPGMAEVLAEVPVASRPVETVEACSDEPSPSQPPCNTRARNRSTLRSVAGPLYRYVAATLIMPVASFVRGFILAPIMPLLAELQMRLRKIDYTVDNIVNAQKEQRNLNAETDRMILAFLKYSHPDMGEHHFAGKPSDRCLPITLGDLRVLGPHPVVDFMFLDTRDVQSTPRILLSTHENGMFIALRSLVKSGAAIIEAGANQGYHTLTMARLVQPYGKIIVVESDPARLAVLCDNVTAHYLQDCVYLLSMDALSRKQDPTDVERSSVNTRLSILNLEDECVRSARLVKIDSRRVDPITVDRMLINLVNVSSVRFLVTFSPLLAKKKGWTRPKDFVERLADSGMRFWRIDKNGDFIGTTADEILRGAGEADVDFLAAGSMD